MLYNASGRLNFDADLSRVWHQAVILTNAIEPMLIYYQLDEIQPYCVLMSSEKNYSTFVQVSMCEIPFM